MFLCNVNSFVYYEHHKGDYVMEHNHNCYECVFYLEGKGSITIDNEVFEYDGPTITISKPKLKHDEKTETSTRLFIMLFDLEDEGIYLDNFNLLKLNNDNIRFFQDAFEKMQKEESEKNTYYQEMLNSIFSQVLTNFIRILKPGKKKSCNQELVQRTKNYIKENYKQDIDFKKIANSFGYSYDRFRHIFVEEKGISLNQYLLNCRLYAAKKLLIETDMSIKDIVSECGFKSSVHFNNFFTKKMNITPQSFRKSSYKQIDVGVFKITSKSIKKILFIDTDIGGDCDDAGALALANIIKNKGVIDIAGMTYTTSSNYGPACIDAINRYYNNETIQIGATSRENYNNQIVSPFLEDIATNYPNSYKDRLKVKDSVKLIREVLSKAQDNSITFVCIGQLDNVSDLLDSSADEYSLLDGISLVKKKVKEFVIMGGLFRKNKNDKIYFCGSLYQNEYNIVTDIKSARNFIKKVPTKVIFSDFLVGNQIYTAKSLLDEANFNNPVTKAYYLFQNKPRESWDLLAMWYAMFGIDDIFSISEEGTVSISKDGETTIDYTKKNNHFILRLNNNKKYIEDKIDRVLIGG